MSLSSTVTSLKAHILRQEKQSGLLALQDIQIDQTSTMSCMLIIGFWIDRKGYRPHVVDLTVSDTDTTENVHNRQARTKIADAVFNSTGIDLADSFFQSEYDTEDASNSD